MKNLNFLSNLCGLGRASQSSDVGSRCRVVADLLPSFCRVNHVLTLLVVMLFTIGVGNVWGADTELTFSLTSNPGGWPTTNSTTLTNYTYTLSGTNYTFALSNVKQNSGYLMLTSTAVLGLPAISGMTLTKVVVSNSSGCSTSTRVGISSSSSSASYISGGAYQTYSTTSSTYTYNLTGTSANTMYYLYVTNKNCQITQLKLTYSGGSTPSLTASPTSLDWGSVAKGTSLSTKTFSISGSNLTSGSLSITASSGWSVSPTSKSVSGTLDPTTITVTPPSTSTAGTKNGTITISGGGLASSVVVNLSLTVNEVDNFIDVVQSTSGYTEGSPHQETGSYSTPTLTDKSVATSGTCEELHYHFVGWITKTKYDAGTSIAVGDLQTPTSATGTTYYAVWAKQAAGGSSNSISLTYTDFGYTSTTYSTKSVTKGGFTFTCKQGCRSNSPYSLQMNSTKTGHLYNTTAIAGLQSVTLKCNATNTGKTATIYQGASQEPTSSSAGTAACAASKNYTINITSGSYFTIAVSGATYFSEVVITYSTITYEDYIAKCCDDPGLAYGTGSVTKTYGNDPFTNPLTNSHSVAVTYALSSVSPAGCVSINNSTGQVTINGAGSATVTASFAGNATYCADEASYTLTVNKANISPTLTYSPNSVAVGENSATPTVGGNTGSGTVTYAITSASPAGCASINTSTGVVTGLAVGSVTVTATIGATDNYNGNTATATVTITAASNFPNNKTIFIQAGKSGSAWSDNACVVAWFHSYGGSETAQPTYWLFDVTAEGDDKGKKLFAAVVPSSGDLPYLDINRYASNCTTPWNKNGGVSYSDASGSNTIRSEGSGNDQVYWNLSGVTIDLHGDPSGDEWASSLASFSDQGAGVWTATYNNYAPANAAGESQEFKAKTNYNGWIGNTGSNNNATLDGMHVGSTYNITATLDVTDHSLTMSKTFVKGTVHFDLQGHGLAISDLTNVTAGSKISAPSPAPSATGYDFGGWFKEPACTNEWNFASDEVDETMTLYAKWTKQTYTITSTLNNCSSSPAIPSSYEYTGSAAGLNYTISPSDGYRLPTEITVSGTTYTWNSATGALALTGTIASNVTITIVAVQTHTVDWYVGGSAPANKIGDDGQTTVVDHGGKIEDFPAHDPDGSACDKTFVGWTNTSSYVHGTSPLFNDVAGSPEITADASFYAVFATGGSTTVYLTESEISTSFVSGTTTSYGNYTITSASGTWGGKITINKVTISATDVYCVGIRKNADNNSLGSPTFSGNISNITVTGRHNAGSARDIYICSSNATAQPTSGDIGSGSIPAGPGSSVYTDWTDVSITPTGDHTSFYIYANGGLQIKTVAVTYGGYSGYTITCADCGTSVTPTYTASPTGGTVSVTKSAAAVASGSTVKTCTDVDLTVTITPASHYTLTGFTATGLTTGTATISPAVNTVVPTTSAQTFTVTVSAGATGTLNLTPTLEEDAHKVISWVVHGGSASIADGHGTTWVYSGEDLTAIPEAPDAPTGCDDKVFVGWSENDRGATEEDASYYDDLFTNLGGAPTGITTDKTFTAVFATPAAGLGGTVMWDEPFDGDAGDQPSSPTSGATVYGSASIAYNCASTTYCKLYTDNLASGGAAAPELLVPKSSRSEAFEVTGIPTAGQTELTLTYMAKDALSVTTGTSGVTVGDASADGKLYTRTITIDQSGLGVATFGLTFAKSTDSNSRLDDIHLEVPGSSSMSGYVTTCEDTWTVTYYKNTEDAVTNLPSPTGISKSTGSGTLSSKVPVRYGYTFDGWATSAGGSVAYAAGAAVSSVSADMDLYAKWSVTPVTEINLSKTSLDKYVGDPSVILSVLSVLPDGANTSVTWSSSNPSVATVNSTTGEVNFVAVGTANIIATSTITSGTTATCAVTVWAKPSVSFLDNLHSLTEDKDGNALSGYNITDVAGTPVVFPVLANQPAGSGTCEDEFYVFVGWTTSDNNTDPEDHLVTSHNLTNGDNITYYAVWANGVSGTTYTKLTSSTFKTSPAKYVIGAAHADSGTEHYFYSCDKTDKNNSWGYVTADLASNTPIEFTLSGTAAALVATSTEVSARYLKPLADKDFQMSASSQTVELKSDGTIYNNNTGDTSWRLLYNKAGGLRWYSSNVSGSTNAYFYEVVAGGEVNYRTSCCADKVAAPTVTATKTSTTVTLTWAAVSGATGYELQWNGGAWTAATSGVVKSDLTPNTNYSWRVRATYDPPKCGADIASGSTTTNQVYHVTYAKGSGTGSCNATGSTTDGTAYEAGATVTLQSNGFTLVGHTFNEWTEDDDDITISSNQFTMPEHDVVITATWTPKVDKFYDRMHDGTDASHGGIRDGDGKYYITREGCSYTVPSLTDNTSGATACHTKHYVLMGWTAENHLNSDGTLKTGHEGYVYTGGGTQTATGATYYAVWAEVEE